MTPDMVTNTLYMFGNETCMLIDLIVVRSFITYEFVLRVGVILVLQDRHIKICTFVREFL